MGERKFKGEKTILMNILTNLLTQLGSYFYFILIGAVELIAAVVLIEILPGRKKQKEKKEVPAGVLGALAEGLNCDDEIACVIVRRSDQMPCYAAGALKKLTGVTLEQLQEDPMKLCTEMTVPEDGQRFFEKYLQWNGIASLTAKFKLEKETWFEIRVRRCPDERYDLFLIQSVTREKQAEAAYEKRLKEAEEASQFKSSFLFRMSHEIRTPMNGINGMLALAKEKLSAGHPATQYLERAEELSDHLLKLINDILDMSRIEAGKIELEERAFSLRALGNKLYDMFAKTLESRGIRYAVNYTDMTADWVIGDELRVSQVIINFLSNAVKFTEKGEISVTFHQMLIKDNNVDLMVRVHDTGIGMNPEFIGRIFRPFEQEDASTTRRFGGTGLGMAISDQLIKLMGGEIIVESTPGQGSDFSLFLTFPMTDAPKIVEAEQLELPETVNSEQPMDVRILLAEDNEVNAIIATEILEGKGAKVEVAGDGAKAVEMFQTHPAQYYDVILMDIQMPVMDGRTAARTIRKLHRADAEKIPIFALSADAFVEDIRLSKESGMDEHISKPVDFEELWKLIQKRVRSKERVIDEA